ncbi:hypothetical protein HDU83_008410 [Entophlyctis luteolus]|nr:hypothetical protein HDU83_008410 [Entophlyctis luteolus]
MRRERPLLRSQSSQQATRDSSPNTPDENAKSQGQTDESAGSRSSSRSGRLSKDGWKSVLSRVRSMTGDSLPSDSADSVSDKSRQLEPDSSPTPKKSSRGNVPSETLGWPFSLNKSRRESEQGRMKSEHIEKPPDWMLEDPVENLEDSIDSCDKNRSDDLIVNVLDDRGYTVPLKGDDDDDGLGIKKSGTKKNNRISRASALLILQELSTPFGEKNQINFWHTN